MEVKCPRCKKVWTVPEGTPDVQCNCHLYCDSGEKPSDCSVTTVTWSGHLNWPRGTHVSNGDTDSDRPSHNYYCSTHSQYYDKVPVLIECDWTNWLRQRANKDLRYFGEETF